MNQARILRIATMRTLALAALAVAASALCGCHDFGDVTGSVQASSAAPAGDADLRSTAESCRLRYEGNPGEKAASIGYARTLRALTRYREAVAVMQTAAVKSPKDEEVLGEYGKALADAGELAQAKDVLTRAYTPDNPRWDIMSVQGAVADQMGDRAGAMQFYRDALKIAPGEPGVLTNMGLSLALAKQLPEAERTLRQAVASPKADARMRGDLALVLALEGKFAEAERVSRTDLSSEAARADVEAIRRMLAATDSPRAVDRPSKTAIGSRTPGEASVVLAADRRRRLPDRCSVPAPAGRTGGTGSASPIGAGGKRAIGAVARPGRRRGRQGDGRCGDPEMGDIERLFDLGRRRQAVGGGGRRQKVRRGRRLADAARAGVGRAVVGEIEMDVVIVEDVRARSEHGVEILAGAGVDLVQKRGLLACRRSSSRARMRACARPSSVKPATSTALPKACSESRAPAMLSIERQL